MDRKDAEHADGVAAAGGGPAAAGLGGRVSEGAVRGGAAPAGAAAAGQVSGRGGDATEDVGPRAGGCSGAAAAAGPRSGDRPGGAGAASEAACDAAAGVLAADEVEVLAAERAACDAAAGVLGRLDEAAVVLGSVALGGLDDGGLREAMSGTGRLRALVDGLMLRIVSRMERSRAGSSREALVGGAKISGRSARRVAETARQVEEMPNVGRLLDAGELPLESVHALCSAAKQCGAATVDASEELLGHAVTRDPGSLSVLARKFAQRHDPSRGRTLLERQRSDRRAVMYVDSDGTGVLKAEMDPVSYALLEQAIAERRDYLWRKDGGRGGAPEAVRDFFQRTRDAVFELCSGRDALTHEPLRPDDGPRGLRRLPPGAIVVVSAGVVDGSDPGAACEMLGAGPVPRSVLDSVSADTRVAGALFGGNGQPLWLGRLKRLGEAGQHLAVALRDRGCVLCRAPMHHCRLHHVEEWHQDRGPTDVENLAALCGPCHRWLHRTSRRLIRHNGPHLTITWTTEPRNPPPRDPKNPNPPHHSHSSSGGGNDCGAGDAVTTSQPPPEGNDPNPPHNKSRGKGGRGGVGDAVTTSQPLPEGSERNPSRNKSRGEGRGGVGGGGAGDAVTTSQPSPEGSERDLPRNKSRGEGRGGNGGGAGDAVTTSQPSPEGSERDLPRNKSRGEGGGGGRGGGGVGGAVTDSQLPPEGSDRDLLRGRNGGGSGGGDSGSGGVGSVRERLLGGDYCDLSRAEGGGGASGSGGVGSVSEGSLGGDDRGTPCDRDGGGGGRDDTPDLGDVGSAHKFLPGGNGRDPPRGGGG